MFVAIVRSLLGVFLLALGVVGLMRIMDPPPDMPEAARKFLGALESTGYMMYMTSGVKVLCGALLLFKRWVPFALVLLAPWPGVPFRIEPRDLVMAEKARVRLPFHPAPVYGTGLGNVREEQDNP